MNFKVKFDRNLGHDNKEAICRRSRDFPYSNEILNRLIFIEYNRYIRPSNLFQERQGALFTIEYIGREFYTRVQGIVNRPSLSDPRLAQDAHGRSKAREFVSKFLCRFLNKAIHGSGRYGRLFE